MKENNKTVVGLDVHKESIVTGVLLPWSQSVTESIRIENTKEALEKMVKQLRKEKAELEFVYEAGVCGYEVYRQLTKMGYRCFVIAPGLIPIKACDRVKTDRRDAEKLARLWRAGELTVVRVPSLEEEASRDIVRVREDAVQDRLRAQHRLVKFLLRQGCVFREGKTGTTAWHLWIKSQKFEIFALQKSYEAYRRAFEEVEARLACLNQAVQDVAVDPVYKIPVLYLRCFKGIDTLSAVTILVEAQDFRRFDTASAFMKFTGLTSSEYSSGNHVRRGAITKAGNAHLRRVLVESAWSYQKRNVTSNVIRKRREGLPAEVIALAKKAQDRLHRRFCRLTMKGKSFSVAITALARELSGFVWSMARHFPKAA
jgi:transposase